MPAFHLDAAAITDVGLVRPTNQDRYLVHDDLFAVADGMGGRAGGEIASRLAVETLVEEFTRRTTDRLLDAVEAANQAVGVRADADPALLHMGTTVVAVARVSDPGDATDPGNGGPPDDDDGLVVVNVGDSRAYLLRDGRLDLCSHDDSLVADLVRAGAITEDEARSHPDRHVITQALGGRPGVEPHVTRLDPTPGDRLLLCSDGLTNELGDEEIAELLAAAASPEEAARSLVDRAKERGGHDNVTVVVIDVTEPPAP